jgi:hypothetical protein
MAIAIDDARHSPDLAADEHGKQQRARDRCARVHDQEQTSRVRFPVWYVVVVKAGRNWTRRAG